ncbi:MAG: hypothetical protein ACRD01_03135 [Terriglobales bacterium]
MTAPPGQLWVGITDSEWFDQLRATASRGPVDEVNFWRPSGLNFRALAEGGLFLFKLHAPRNVIAGGGFFTRAVPLPVHLAWQAFGALNGVTSEAELRGRIRRYRGEEREQPITCIVLPGAGPCPATPRPHSKGCGAPARGPASPSRREPRRAAPLRLPGAGRPSEFHGPSRRLCPQCKRRDSRDTPSTVGRWRYLPIPGPHPTPPPSPTTSSTSFEAEYGDY